LLRANSFAMENYEIPSSENIDNILNDPTVWEEAEKEAKQSLDGKMAAKMAMAGFQRAASDPSEIQKTMALANDPDAMRQAQELMQDPDFKAEMGQILQNPQFQAAMDRAKKMFQDLMTDPEKMNQLQDMMSSPEKMAEMQAQYMKMFAGGPAPEVETSNAKVEEPQETDELKEIEAEEDGADPAADKKKKTRRGGKKHKKKTADPEAV